MANSEDIFQEIAEQTIEHANKVPCDIEEYISGMELIVSELRVSIQAAKDG